MCIRDSTRVSIDSFELGKTPKAAFLKSRAVYYYYHLRNIRGNPRFLFFSYDSVKGPQISDRPASPDSPSIRPIRPPAPPERAPT